MAAEILKMIVLCSVIPHTAAGSILAFRHGELFFYTSSGGCMQDSLSKATSQMLRRFSLIAGCALAVFALFADLFGISGSGFSTGQVLILFTSALLIATGLLGNRFFKYYRNTATFLLNILILM